MDPFKKQIDDRTSYKSLDEQFYEARLDRAGIDQSDWPSQIDRAAIDVSYGVALGTTGSAFDHGGTIGRNDFGGACGPHYVQGLRALAGSQSDLPQLIRKYEPEELGDLAFRLNELRVELEKLELSDSEISDLNRTIEALVEKLITQGSSGDLARQPLQKPEAVADLLYQLFSDPAVTTYADILIESITGKTGTAIGNRSLLEHLDRPQMVTPLWDHQQKAMKRWVKADTQGYVNMATATGKTVLGLAAIAHEFGELHPADTDCIPPAAKSPEENSRILIVAGQDLLLKQWQSEFDEHLNIPRSRTVQTQMADENVIELTWGDIEFRTAQELLNSNIQHAYDLVILDEAHRYSSGRRGSRGWRDLFEELIDTTDSILAMSGSIDDEWLGDDSVKNALEANLEQCIEFTIEDARAQNVIADFRWDVCYVASDTGESVDSIVTSTKPLASVYNSTHHKFEPHELSESIPEAVPDRFETLRDLRSFAHTNEGKQARDDNDAFDRFATAAFSRKPKRWQLSPPTETISQLLKEHLPERKCIVLVQSYAQAETIGDHLKKQYREELIMVPEQSSDAPWDSVTEFKNASQGVLVGPGEALGVGVDLPNADVAINLAKGGVNASLIQRIGRILRNPTGDKKAHFYQVVTIASDPEARLPGEDGRRLLRRASEFQALGSRFRERPGFVVADNIASEIVRVLETHGSQAKIKDERPTEEIVEDDVARRFLDELTAEIDSKVGESLPHPVLTTYWKPESLSPGTLPVQKYVKDLDQGEQSESDPGLNSESEIELKSKSNPKSGNGTNNKPATVIVEVSDSTGEPISDASVVIEDPLPIDKTTTNASGVAIFNLPVFTDDVCVSVSKEGYQSLFTSTSVTEGEQRVAAELASQAKQTGADNSSVEDSQEGIDENNPEPSTSDFPSREEVLAEIRKIDPVTGNFPRRSDFIKQSKIDIEYVYGYFKSWSKAYEASKYLTKNDVLEEISRLKTEIGPNLTRSEFEERSQINDKYIYEIFDSWHDAVQALDQTELSKEAIESNETPSDDGKKDTPASTSEISKNEVPDGPESADDTNQLRIPTGPESIEEVDLTRRDLVIELVSLTQELQRVPTKDEISEHGQFTYRDYQAKFGDLYEAAQQAGIIEDSVTRSEFFGETETNGDQSESEEESKGSESANRASSLSQEIDDGKLSSSSTGDFAELTSFKRDILTVLWNSDGKSGLDIKDEVEQYYDSTVNHGRLYPNLDSLVDSGYVTKQSADKRTNSYALTDLGRSLIYSRQKWVANCLSEISSHTTESDCQDNTPPKDNLTWTEAIRRELDQYQDSVGEDVVTLSELHKFSEQSLSEQFPDNNHIRAKIRQQLQSLRDEGEIEFLEEPGTYQIRLSEECNQKRSDLPENTAQQEVNKPSPEDLISEVQLLDDEVSGYPLTTEMRQMGDYEPEQYYAEFGSWEDALKAAGIDKKDRLIQEIRRVAQELGSEPNTTDMNEHSSYSSGTFSQYFGGWSNALDAANIDEIPESSESENKKESPSSGDQNNATSSNDNQTKSSNLVDSIMDDIEHEFENK